jgi:uncharacterized membrane protein
VASAFSRKDNRGVTRVVAPLLASAAVAWVALLVAAPFLPASVAGILYAFGAGICHQIPERSFYVEGSQLPVCGRCFGVYAGAAIAALASCGPSLVRLGHVREARLLLIAAIPTLVTIALEWTGLHASNLARAAAGAPLGGAVALIVMAAVRAPALHYEPCPPTRPPDPNQPAPPI